MTLLQLYDVASLQAEVRELARERDAVILAHNYQLPEIQDVADYVGDSLGLSRQAAASPASVIAFCGVHFMAETASVLSPEKTVLIPDVDAGCSLADAITPDQLRAWQAQHPGAITVMYVNTTAAVKALTDYCVTSANAVAGRRAHPARARAGHGDPVRAGHVPRRLRRAADRPFACTSGTASATSTPASARATSSRCAPSTRARTSSSIPSAAARPR